MDAERQLKWKALDQIRVAKNCPASWRQMHGDDRVRHCTHCDRNVYNLSNMTRDEAAELIDKTEGRLCVRFYQRRDGMLMTRDCGKALRAKWVFMSWLTAVLALCGFTIAPAFQATTGARKVSPEKLVTIYQERIDLMDEEIAGEKDAKERESLKARREDYVDYLAEARKEAAEEAKAE